MAQVFSCEFCEISKNTFFTEHLLTTPSLNEVVVRIYFIIHRRKHKEGFYPETLLFLKVELSRLSVH